MKANNQLKGIMMNAEQKTKLANEIYKTCHLTGNFVLRSGRHATEYFDKYQLSANAALLNEITKRMAELVPEGVEVIAGLEMGAIPVVTMLAQHTGLPAAFVRKVAKEHGTARLAEGTSIVGKKVLVIEDVVTSGGQVVISTKDLKALGADITHALVIIDRKEGAREVLADAGIELISLINRDDFAASAK
jgi:orotate phosphoribosyltransferase